MAETLSPATMGQRPPRHVLCANPEAARASGLCFFFFFLWSRQSSHGAGFGRRLHDIKGGEWTFTAGWRSRFGQGVRALRSDPNTQKPCHNSAASSSAAAKRRWGATSRNIADHGLSNPEGAASEEAQIHWEEDMQTICSSERSWHVPLLLKGRDKTLAGCLRISFPIQTSYRQELSKAMLTKTPHLGKKGVQSSGLASRAARRKPLSTRGREMERKRSSFGPADVLSLGASNGSPASLLSPSAAIGGIRDLSEAKPPG